MEQDAPEKSASTPASAPATPAGDNASPSQPIEGQVDLADAPLEQLDELFTTGKVAVGPASEGSDGGGKVSAQQPPAPATPAEPAPAAPATPETPSVPETPAAPETPAGVTPPETPAAPETQATPAEPVQPATPQTPTDKEDVQPIKRPRLNDPDDQQIAAIYKHAKENGKPISWAEAEHRVKGDPAQTQAQTPIVNTAQAVEQLRGEVAEIERELEEKAGQEGVLYDKNIKDLQTSLTDKKTDLKLAERDLVSQENAVKEVRKTARLKAHARAIDKFPSVADGESPLGKAVAARIAALRSDDSPILYDDEAPWLIALNEATRLGIAPVAEKSAPAAPAAPPSSTATPATPAAPARKVVSPPSGAHSSAPATPGNPQAEKAKSVEYLKTEAPLEELDKLFMPGGKDNLLFAVAGR